MVKLNRAQRVALLKVFNRQPLVVFKTRTRVCHLTYRGFRETVQGTFLMDGAVTVKWCGMWLAIEKDGYTHS